MKRFAAILTIVVSLGVCFYLLYKPDSLPTADLASPSQEVRDAAAKILRAKAKPPLKVKWFFAIQRIKTGQTKEELLKYVRGYNPDAEPEPTGGLQGGFRGSCYAYHLDSYWALECHFSESGILDKWRLSPGWRCYYVRPATNFSGVWVNYFANGQKCGEEHLLNGQRHGEDTTYYPDGQKSSVWHYDNGKLNGMRTAYFPSGQIQYQSQYSNSIRVGDEVSFYTNGSVVNIYHYEDGKRNGPHMVYFLSGKIKSLCLYSNSTRVGIEVNYNEDGTTNSIINHSQQ